MPKGKRRNQRTRASLILLHEHESHNKEQASTVASTGEQGVHLAMTCGDGSSCQCPPAAAAASCQVVTVIRASGYITISTYRTCAQIVAHNQKRTEGGMATTTRAATNATDFCIVYTYSPLRSSRTHDGTTIKVKQGMAASSGATCAKPAPNHHQSLPAADFTILDRQNDCLSHCRRAQHGQRLHHNSTQNLSDMYIP